jgi:prolycopene isomerase
MTHDMIPKDERMSQKFDVVVVGAGLGGLASAAFLANKGYDVCLLERHNIPGGYATSFVRGRYEFETALHELSDLGSEEHPGMLRQFLEQVGVFDQLEFLQSTDIYRAVFPDFDITMPMGFTEYRDTLCQAFPHETAGITRFLDRIYTVAKEIDAVSDLQSISLPRDLPKLVSAPLKARNLPRYLFASWADVLHRDVYDKHARAVISQIWGYFGLPPRKVAFLYFAAALASYLRSGAMYVKGRSQALSNVLVEGFESNGGVVRFNCGASAIIVRDGHAIGVLTDDGDEIQADRIVSNADPVTTVRDLIGLEHVPAEYIKKLRSNPVAASSFNVYLGLAAPLSTFGINDHEIFINRDTDFDDHHARMKRIDTPGGMAATCYNVIYPDISPEGTSVITLTTLAYGQPWLELPPHEYADRKTQVAESMLDMAQIVFPGLRDVIEVAEVSTPLTNMRYAGTLGGSIYGFEQTPFNHSVLRLPPQGPIPHLYQVGAWVQPGGGFAPAVLSGQMAGEAIHRSFSRSRG